MSQMTRSHIFLAKSAILSIYQMLEKGKDGGEKRGGVGGGGGGGQNIKPCDAQLDLLFCFISSFILYGILFYKEKYGGSTFYTFL